MVLSAVPPPDTRRPCWWGDQVTALTAAIWSLYLRTGSQEWLFQMSNLLSLPPEHSCCSSKDHFKPHISCLCPKSLLIKGEFTLKSRWRMVLSLDPVLRMLEFHEMAPTLLECPVKVLTFLIFTTSQISTFPLFVPSERWGPFSDQETEVARSVFPKSHNFWTFELDEFHI